MQNVFLYKRFQIIFKDSELERNDVLKHLALNIITFPLERFSC